MISLFQKEVLQPLNLSDKSILFFKNLPNSGICNIRVLFLMPFEIVDGHGYLISE